MPDEPQNPNNSQLPLPPGNGGPPAQNVQPINIEVEPFSGRERSESPLAKS